MGTRLPGPPAWLAEIYVPVVPRPRAAPAEETVAAASDTAEPDAGPVLVRHAAALAACLLLLLAVIAAAQLVVHS